MHLLTTYSYNTYIASTYMCVSVYIYIYIYTMSILYDIPTCNNVLEYHFARWFRGVASQGLLMSHVIDEFKF